MRHKGSIISKVKGDPLAYLWLKPFQMWQRVHKALCSLWTYLLAKAKGVDIASMPVCAGVPYIFRSPYSTIRIGRHFQANSSFKSNNIGILSRSRLTTNDHGAAIIIGDNVGISAATISAFRRIVIGDHTLIGGNVLITDSDWHPLDPAMRRIPFAEGRCADVVIGSNVFIGTRSIILKGVTIGDNSVIGAGSVVTRDIPANVIAAGNPCVVVKHL